MLNRSIGALSAVALVLIVCAGTLLAQERVKMGRFDHFYGNAKVKEIGATGTYVQLQDSWLNQGVYKGDEIVTSVDSKVEIMIESTKVTLLDKSHVVMDKTDEGLYVVNMIRGNVIANIKTDVFQLRVSNQTIYGKGSEVSVKIEPNKDIIIKALYGAPYIDNEYGATLVVPQEQVLVIKYDRLKREYIFQPSFENTTNVGVLPKGERKPIEIGKKEEYVIYEDGTGKLQKYVPPTTIIDTPPPPPPKREFSIDALVRYDWFQPHREAYKIYYYRSEKETYETTRAALGVGTKYRFAEIFLKADAIKDNPLEDLWLRLFLPKHEEALNLKVGQMRVPFGLQCQTDPEDLLLPEYSQAVKYAFAAVQGDPATSDLDRLYDAGGQVYGEFELFADLGFQYAAGYFNGEKRNTADTNSQKTAAGRFGLNFGDSFIIGCSNYDGVTTWGASRIHRMRTGVDVKISTDQFMLHCEYIRSKDWPIAGKKYKVTEGTYVEAGLNLSVLKESLKKWMFVARFDNLAPPKGTVDPGAKDQTVASTAFAFGLVWKLSEEVKFIAAFEILDQGGDRYLNVDIDNDGVGDGVVIKEGDASKRAIFQFNISF